VPDAAREAIHQAMAEAEISSRDQTHGNCSSSGIQARINCPRISRITHNPLSPTGC
jgi:hypothetical protein